MRAINNAIRSGQIINNPTFTGVAKFADGSAAAPSITFTNAPTNGFFNSAGNLCLSMGGSQRWFWDTSGGLNATGNQSITMGSASVLTIGTAALAQGAVGVFKFTAAGSFSANGSVATSMTSLGPAGSHTTIQTWLTIVDSAGTTRYIPCY